VTQLAERYAPDNVWFLNTMNAVFTLGGDLVQEETAHNLMRLVAEGSGEDEDADHELKVEAVSTYASLLASEDGSTVGCDILLHVIAWVCGEYAYLCDPEEEGAEPGEDGLHDPYTERGILDRLCQALEQEHSDATTRGWLVSAVTKIAARLGASDAVGLVSELLDKYTSSRSLDLSQRCYEALALLSDSSPAHTATAAAVLPLDGSCEDLEVDPELPFLDGFVARALASGAKPRLDADAREEVLREARSGSAGYGAGGAGGGAGGGSGGGALRFESYAAPVVGGLQLGGAPGERNLLIDSSHPSGGTGGGGTGDDGGGDGAGGGAGAGGAGAGGTGLVVSGVKKKWGRGGYQTGEGGAAGAAAGAAPGAAHTTTTAAAAAASAAASVPTMTAAEAYAAPVTMPTPSLNGSSSATASTSDTLPEPSRPRTASVTEREKLAASLFGGGAADAGSSSSSAGGAGRGRGRAAGKGRGRGRGRGVGGKPAGAGAGKPPAAAAAAPPPASASSNNDLLLDLDMGMGGSSTTTTTTAAAAPSSTTAVDLLDLFSTPNPTPSPAAAPVMPMAMGGGGGGGGGGAASLDPFGMLNPTPAAGGGGLPNYDALRSSGGTGDANDLLGAFGAAPTGIMPGAGAPVPVVPVPADLAAQLTGHPRSHDTQQLLARDAALCCSYYLVQAPGAAVVALFLTSVGTARLGNVQAVFDPPSSLALGIGGSPAPRVSGQKCTWDAIEAGASAVGTLTLGGAQFAAVSDVLGRVTYSVGGEQRSVNLRIPTTIADLVRPHRITTPEFGRLWGSLGNERKGRINGVCTSPPELSSRMQRFVNAHPVQTINVEVIIAAKIAGTDRICLFHGKCTSAGVDLMIRSGDKKLSDALWTHCAKVLA
jgi:AP-4 complex subunit epsilon-1